MRTKRSAQLAAVAVTGTAILIATAACNSGAAHSAAPQPAVSSPAPSASSPAPSTSASPTGCDVTADDLFAVLKAKPEAYTAVASPSGLRNLACVPGFAIATTAANPSGLESARILFRYDSASNAWQVVTEGTGFDCTEHMSKQLATQLGC
jgi:hypothetical protein